MEVAVRRCVATRREPGHIEPVRCRDCALQRQPLSPRPYECKMARRDHAAGWPLFSRRLVLPRGLAAALSDPSLVPEHENRLGRWLVRTRLALLSFLLTNAGPG